jgi:agmatine deiminase
MSQLLGIGILKNPLAIEGGEIELNGKGVALIADSFTRRRNPFISDKTFDSLLHISLGVTKLIRLREGLAEDPAPGKSRLHGDLYGTGVGGHVDEFARFVNATTIFLAMPDSAESAHDPVKKLSYERMRINELILKDALDQEGKPFNIIHLPIPDVIPDEFVMDTSSFMHPVASLHREYPELKNGDRIRFLPAVSYLNYVVLNDLVVIPSYWKPGFPEACKQKDEQVRALYARYFPGKTIIQLDPWGMNYGGGGFHCWTQQVPEGN